MSQFVASNFIKLLTNMKSYKLKKYEQALIETYLKFDELLRLEKVNQLLIKQYNNIIKLVFDYGQWKSIKNFNSCDASSMPVPWYTYPATEYLQHLDLLQFKVHEFGSGNSTLWWSKQVKCITSV